MLERDEGIVGYASLRSEGRVLACDEGMGRSERARSLLLRSLESEGSGRWLMLGSSMIDELRNAPGIHDYTIERSSYGVLMARSLAGPVRRSDLAHELGTDRPGFLIGTADAF